MDRSALAARNSHLIRALHKQSFRESIRGRLLHDLASLPIARQPGGTGRLLVMRPDHLGDVLLTIPALRALRSAHPGKEIHALVGSWSAGVLEPITAIDTVLTIDFPGFARDSGRTNLIAPYLLAHTTARTLRRIGYDAAYILRPDHWWGALTAFLAGIPVRIGYDTAEMRQFLTDARPHTPTHAVVANWRLTQPRGAPDTAPVALDYPVDDESRLAANDALRARGIDPHQPYLVIHVGSGATVKNWDLEKWGVVANAVAGGLDGAVIITGSARERSDADRLASLIDTGIPTANLAGETTLSQLAAVLAGGRAVLGADSGPMHLAAAVGTPTVTLFGPADPDEFRPWGDPARQRVVTTEIACRPCRILDWAGDDLAFHPCVRDISPAAVIDAAWRAINAASPG